MSSYAQWMARTKQQTQGTVKTPARAARNDFRLVGRVLSLYKKEKNTNAAAAAAAASGSVTGGSSSSTSAMANKPKWNIVVQLGSLQNHPDVKKEIVDATEREYRVFEIISKPTATNKIAEYRGELPTSKKIYSHDTLSCSVAEDELQNSGGVEVGDIVELRGINFSNWYSKNAGVEHITTYCNVDKIARVKGAERSNFGYDLFMDSGRPVRRIKLETNDDADHEGGDHVKSSGLFKAILGREVYAFNYFGNDAATADAYMARPEYEICHFDFEPKADPTNPQRQIVTFRPDVFNKAAGSGFTTENGFKTIATGTQHFVSGDEQTVLSWVKLQREHVAPFGISDEQTWNAVAPRLLEQSKYTVLVKENLEKTSNESFNTAEGEDVEDEGVDFKLASSVQTMLINLPEEIERIGVRVPDAHLADLMGTLIQQQQAKGGDTMLASPMHDGAYHSRPDRSMVISLNEWSGNLTELIKQGAYDFYIVTDINIDEETRGLLNNEPIDKQYLMFDTRFRTALNKEKGQAAKLAVSKKFGLDEDTEMPQLVALGVNAKSRVFYAVLKPERRFRDYIDRAAFVEAVRLYVPDPEATLARLRQKYTATASGAAATSADEKGEHQQGMKRAAEKEAGDEEDTKRKGKRAKKNSEEPSSSHQESADEAPASPAARKGSKKNKH